MPKTGKRGLGTSKEPVAVLVERDGLAVCRPVPNATTLDFRRLAKTFVAGDATLMTDESQIYHGADANFSGGHFTVRHTDGEYARQLENGMVAHNNTAESFFALLKRGHYGIFHQLSKRHLRRYCDEFSFRWKHRKVSDGHRMTALIDAAEGKRLKYRHPITRSLNLEASA